MVGCEAIDRQDTVADEAVAYAGAHRHLVQTLGEFEAGGDDIGADPGWHHDFQQLHDVRGREEVQAQHVLRPRRGGRDLLDVEVRGVAGQHRPGLADAVELGEHRLLHRHVFEHRFDHDVHLAQRVVGGRTGQSRHQRAASVGAHAALGHQRVIDLLHVGAAARQAFGVALDHRHRQAGVEHRHRDAGAHRAAADYARRTQGAWRRSLRPRHLGHFALGEERMDKPLALRAVDALQEELALQAQTLVEGPFQRGLDGVDDLRRREQAS